MVPHLSDAKSVRRCPDRVARKPTREVHSSQRYKYFERFLAPLVWGPHKLE